MRGLLNKVVVVAAGGTGAASGEAGAGASIGGATSCRLAAEGALVVVGDRDLAAAERTVGLIDEAGGKAVAHLFDAVDGGQIEGLMERAVEEFGGLDGLHYNAADQSRDILGKDLTLDLLGLPLDVWNKTIEIGLTGYLLACRTAIPLMLARGGGAIVGTASSAAYVGRPDTLAYGVAKLGMTAVMRHIASRSGSRGHPRQHHRSGHGPGQTHARQHVGVGVHTPHEHSSVAPSRHGRRYRRYGRVFDLRRWRMGQWSIAVGRRRSDYASVVPGSECRPTAISVCYSEGPVAAAVTCRSSISRPWLGRKGRSHGKARGSSRGGDRGGSRHGRGALPPPCV